MTLAPAGNPGLTNDYGPIADLYDAFVTFDLDLGFFRSLVVDANGPVLETMAGTGRVSAALHHVVQDLVCLDISRDMLRQLARKVPGTSRPRGMVCADVRGLPFRNRFALILFPFHSFAELTGEHDRRQALLESRTALRQRGRLVVTLHNPPHRVGTLDGALRVLQRTTLPDGRTLEVGVRGEFDRESRLAVSRDIFTITARDGSVSRRECEIRFALIEPDAFCVAAEGAGFRVIEAYGDYDRSPFDATSSPYFLSVLDVKSS